MPEGKMPKEKAAKKDSPFSIKILIVSFIFGVIALGVVLGGLLLPIPGTNVKTDPRELFTTYGAAFSGPIGGIIVGILAGIAEPNGIPLASLLGHIAGCLWMGFAYKKIIYKRFASSYLIFPAWFAAILIYYYVFVIPGFIIGLAWFYNQPLLIMEMLLGGLPEALLTSIVTTLALFAIPKAYRKPLW
jgi:hypothetical protein